MGIEVTEYLEREIGGSELRRNEKLRGEIVRNAQVIFEQTSKSQVFAVVWWGPDVQDDRMPRSLLEEKIAATVSDLVLRGESTWKPNWREPGDWFLGSYIHAVDARRSRRHVDWESAVSAAVPDDVGKIQNVLNGKEPCLGAYLESAAKIWLLIVAEPAISTWFSPDENFDGAAYRTSFDRVFLYDGFKGRVIEPKIHVDAL